MRPYRGAFAVGLASLGFASTHAFTGPALTTARSGSSSSSRSRVVASTAVSDTVAPAAASAADEQYSPPQLVAALRETSAQSPPLGVEGIFSAMARDDVFVNELWQKKPFFCDASLPSLAGQYTLDDVQQAVDSDFVEVGVFS
ncbi:unnamed protein product [Ectocarpus sp. 8 AP-2014]